MVVSKQTYDPTNVNIGPAVAALRASGAQVVVSFSIPAFTALLKLNSLKLGFNPTLVVSNVGSDPITLSGLLEAYAKQGGAKVNGNQLINGIISDGYLPTLGARGQQLDRAVQEGARPVRRRRRRLDGNVLYGRPSATRSCRPCSRRAGTRPGPTWSRRSRRGCRRGPRWHRTLILRVTIMGITGAYMGVIQNGQLVQQGSVLTTDASASGAISTYSGSEQQAPASGIPSP